MTIRKRFSNLACIALILECAALIVLHRSTELRTRAGSSEEQICL